MACDPSVFVCRLDLATQGIAKYYYVKDFGYIIRRGRGRLSWWASNDVRTKKIGVDPNQELCPPTLGPSPALLQPSGPIAKNLLKDSIGMGLTTVKGPTVP